jgi:hypothetical protein
MFHPLYPVLLQGVPNNSETLKSQVGQNVVLALLTRWYASVPSLNQWNP